MKARFWHFWNGTWVKLSLVEYDQDREDETSIQLYRYTPNDEGGGFAEYETLYLQDGFVHLRRDTQSKDCDGSASSAFDAECGINNLQIDPIDASFFPGMEGMMLPKWEERFSRQRDHAAEAAGY